jgi:hypothetical protein
MTATRDHDERDPDLLLQLGQLEAHGLAQFGVERRERLVEQQDLRLFHQRPRERNTLALAARQLIRHARGKVSELYEVERFLHAPVPFRLRHAFDLETVGDVVGDRHMRKDGIGLEHHVHRALVGRDVSHVLAVDQDPALGRHLEAGQHAQQCRLAAARWPEQGEELSRLDVEADIVHPDRGAPPLRNVAEADDGLDGGFGALG